MKLHTFHIPVMGIGFTVDTPIKIGHLGFDSVVFISDDILLEKLRKKYSKEFNLVYEEISNKIDDFRAKRITSYLNMVNAIVKKKFEDLKDVTINYGKELKRFINLLPEGSALKTEYKHLITKNSDRSKIKDWAEEKLVPGRIDVNIMTKLDRANYKDDDQLPVEFNDAHAALRGYANSDLHSSIVFSAGMNPRLFGYIERFEDFFPDNEGNIKKKIVLKVSDYRSAHIQGVFLAKKGIWVSEFRVESGLNCGGHAFASDGYLMGPILEEFKLKRNELHHTIYETMASALKEKNKVVPEKMPEIKISAQGGVGTALEHQFLLEHYEIDSVGWGSPFLLVPEATSVDQETRKKLKSAVEKDLYLSNVSPLGVPFNNLRGNSKDQQKLDYIAKGRPGSACPKKYLALNTEFTEKPICTASRQYQHLKLQELEKSIKSSTEESVMSYNEIVEPSCLCVGLGTSALLVNNIDHKTEGDAVLICPGPNMAYFSKELELEDMIGHIYGKNNVISRSDRPNMFIKELGLYIDYLMKKMNDIKGDWTNKDYKYFDKFTFNLKEGINYYKILFTNESILSSLKKEEMRLEEWINVVACPS